MKLRLLSLLLALPLMASAQEFSLEKLMQSKPEQFGRFLENPAKYRIQILYTQIDRDKKNHPHFRTYGYRVNAEPYFYPASTVKLPASLMALEKLKKLGIPRNASMLTEAGEPGQTAVERDTTATSGLPSVEHYIKKILLVSDNDAFNRLYEFVGQEALNDGLHAKGYKDLRLVHRLSIPLSPEQNRHTNPIRFLDEKGNVRYRQPMAIGTKNYFPAASLLLGKGYMTGGANFYGGETLVDKPMDFTQKNYFSLPDQHEILKAILFPDDVDKQKRFDITPDDYRFLYQYMSELPTESKSPKYPNVWPAVCKFFIYGAEKGAKPTLRIFNKIGGAYGFTLDNAYIVDFDKGIEFMLTAVIYANEDEIFNDDKYDYETVGYPFLKYLGQAVYDYELTRQRPRRPDLTRFRVSYDK